MSKSNVAGVTFTLTVILAAWMYTLYRLAKYHAELIECYKEQTRDTVHIDTSPPL